jgi:hypothetical protein
MHGFNLYRKLSQHQAIWRKIAKQTAGEHDHEDVLNVAWIMATEWPPHKPFDPDHTENLDQLCAKVFNHLVKFSEKNLRYASRIDQPTNQFDPDQSTHPLLNQLSDHGSGDPLHQLIELEASTDDIFNNNIQNLGHTILAGFIILLDRIHLNRKNSAFHLNISYSWLYRCIKRAEKLYHQQLSLFDAEGININTEQLQGWRHFNLALPHMQQPLAIEEQISLDFADCK